jgi:hypothetical protein
VTKEGIGEGTLFLPANPGDEIKHHSAGPIARILYRCILDDATALVSPSGKRPLLEYRGDHQQAKPVRESTRIVAVALSVSRDAVKDHEQGRVGARRRAVGEDHHACAVHVDHLAARLDRRRRERPGAEQPRQCHDGSPDACGFVHFHALACDDVSQNRHD